VLANDPTQKYVAPVAKDPVPFLNFSSLQNALAALEKASNQFTELQVANPKPNTNLDRLNQILFHAEQKLMISNGLPRRPWYKHSIYAPGFYTGYGVKTIPGVREAIEQRNWKEAQEQIENVSKAIETYTNEVKSASAILMMR
jgi:N-acetylated-alpha-linked acidic dipeptidase